MAENKRKNTNKMLGLKKDQSNIRNNRVGLDYIKRDSFNVSKLWRNNTSSSSSNFNSKSIVDELETMSMIVPQAHFLCKQLPADAISQDWIYVDDDSNSEVVSSEIMKKINVINKKLNLKNIVLKAIQISYILGQSVIATIPNKWDNELNLNLNLNIEADELEFEIEAFYYNPDMIRYNSDGTIKEIMVKHKVGLVWKNLYIPKEYCVLFVNEWSWNTSKITGTSALMPVYLSIIRKENIMESWAKIVNQKGMGLLNIHIENGTKDQVADMKASYKDPSQFSTIFSYGKMELKNLAGIAPGFDIGTTHQLFIKEFAAGSNIPEAKLNGVQSGQVTGSETDMDHYASLMKSVQNKFLASIIKVYGLIDPTLKESFSIKWDIKMRMDKQRNAQTLSIIADYINNPAISSLITVNQARKYLDLDPMENIEEGNKILEKYLEELGANKEENKDPFSSMKNAQIPIPDNQKDTGNDTAEYGLDTSMLKNFKHQFIRDMYLISGIDGEYVSNNSMLKLVKQNFGSAVSKTDLQALKNQSFQVLNNFGKDDIKNKIDKIKDEFDSLPYLEQLHLAIAELTKEKD